MATHGRSLLLTLVLKHGNCIWNGLSFILLQWIFRVQGRSDPYADYTLAIHIPSPRKPPTPSKSVAIYIAEFKTPKNSLDLETNLTKCLAND